MCCHSVCGRALSEVAPTKRYEAFMSCVNQHRRVPIIEGAGISEVLDLMSFEKLREWERAMATWWDQVVLPVGRLQDRVNAGVG